MKAYRDKDNDLWLEVEPDKIIIVDEYDARKLVDRFKTVRHIDDVNSEKYGPLREV